LTSAHILMKESNEKMISAISYILFFYIKMCCIMELLKHLLLAGGGEEGGGEEGEGGGTNFLCALAPYTLPLIVEHAVVCLSLLVGQVHLQCSVHSSKLLLHIIDGSECW
jgi:hypothetical protein